MTEEVLKKILDGVESIVESTKAEGFTIDKRIEVCEKLERHIAEVSSKKIVQDELKDVIKGKLKCIYTELMNSYKQLIEKNKAESKDTPIMTKNKPNEYQNKIVNLYKLY